MPVSVRLPTVLRPHASGQSVVEAPAGSVGDIVTDLLRQPPDIRDAVGLALIGQTIDPDTSTERRSAIQPRSVARSSTWPPTRSVLSCPEFL